MVNVLTPGPTKVRENVRAARALETTNPDLDPEFFSLYQKVTARYSKLLGSGSPSFILSGEGILGLEAAVASLTEPGDRVLVLENGVYGRGFADFVRLYGGEPVLYSVDPHLTIAPEPLRNSLKKDSNFKYATLVHCDTPSGMLNDVQTLCPILKEAGLLTVVDSVSGMFGNPLDVRRARIDILLGGSQKALSCPPGLTLVTVSHEAFHCMESRKTPVTGFYCNLLNYRFWQRRQEFPYTMPVSDIVALNVALDNIEKDKGILSRHTRISAAVRAALIAGGLSLYGKEGFSGTVTAFKVPRETTGDAILTALKDEHGILLGGSYDFLKDKVIRIGHMGENCNEQDMVAVLSALTDVLPKLGFPLKGDMLKAFRYHIEDPRN